MHFVDLYNSANVGDTPYVRFEYLRERVNGHHPNIGRVDVIRVEYSTPTSSAYYRLAASDRTSSYDEEFPVAEIVYCSSLDVDLVERRYMLTKELMHVFDTPDQMASSRERFIQLMREVQNRPLPQHESAMYKSELDTRWMAALVLCPRRLRQPYFDKYAGGQVSLAEVAEALRIPDWVASSVMDEYYDVAHSVLVDGDSGEAA